MLETAWHMKPVDSDDVNELAAILGTPVPIATALIHRGLDTPRKANDFWDLSVEKLHDPWLLPDIEAVVDRLELAIKNKDHIYIHGDYDVDGVTSTAVITHSLNLFGAKFEYHVPHRINDGYDVRVKTVEAAMAAGAKILMTVDCGIVAFEAATYAKEHGIDLIITDHHHPSDDGRIPIAVGVVNPNRHDSQYPFNGLAGVGIAFKTMLALAERIGFSHDRLMNELLDYVALGTVADVAPMIDENRILVALGCAQLTAANKPGVAELLKVAGVKSVNTTSIGFFLGPRINAIGRLGDSAIALNLLLEKVPSRAAFYADILNKANEARQKKEKQTVDEALALVPEDMEDVAIIVVAAKGWHPGLVGLVSGKIAEQYARPTLACTINENGKAKGSCRSTRHFHILDALKSEGCWELFSRRADGSVVCGGHAFAAGFELPEENIDLLRERLNIYAKKVSDGKVETKRIFEIDAPMMVSHVSDLTFRHLSKMAPFGANNLEPIFLLKNVMVEEVSTVGAEGKHLKMKVKSAKSVDKSVINAIAWRRGEDAPEVGDCIDIIGKLSLEEFRGRTSLSITVEDFKPTAPGNVTRISM